MAEWKVLAPRISAGSLEQQQLHIIVNVIHPPLLEMSRNYLSINAVFIQKVFSNLYVCNKPYSLKTYILKLQVRNHHCTTLQTE